MKELLKIIYETEEMLKYLKAQCQSEKEQMMKSVIHDLSEIDHKIELHFNSKTTADRQNY